MQDGTYIMSNGQYFPVTPDYGYFIAVVPETRAALRAPFMGVYTDSDGITMQEPSTWLPTRSGAQRRAELHSQYSFWDCLNGKEIPTVAI
jgi:hypothetical protein